MPIKNTATGNRALFKIRGETIGAAQNVSCSDDFGLQDVDGLGDVEATEMVVGKITHNISGSNYFIAADTLRKLGFVPTAEEWLTAPEFEIEIVDKVTGETIELYTGCKFATHSREYNKNTITGQSWSCRSLHKEV